MKINKRNKLGNANLGKKKRYNFKINFVLDTFIFKNNLLQRVVSHSCVVGKTSNC